jgi:hypothetical protein
MSDNLCTRDVTLFIDRLAERAVQMRALSQTRNDARTNPAFRHALYLVAIRAADYPVSHANALIDFQRDVIRQLRQDESRPIATLSDAEQQAAGEETSAQVRYREARPATRRHWTRTPAKGWAA